MQSQNSDVINVKLICFLVLFYCFRFFDLALPDIVLKFDIYRCTSHDASAVCLKKSIKQNRHKKDLSI